MVRAALTADASVEAIEQQLKQAKIAEIEAQKAWEVKTKQQQRDMDTRILNAGNELRAMRKQAADLLAQKPDFTRPQPETRGLARLVLRETPDQVTTLPRLSQLDPTFGNLNGISDRVQRFILAGIPDQAIHAGADDLECQLHRAVLARLRFLAGEVEA
jgi:hypothetical protein